MCSTYSCNDGVYDNVCDGDGVLCVYVFDCLFMRIQLGGDVSKLRINIECCFGMLINEFSFLLLLQMDLIITKLSNVTRTQTGNGTDNPLPWRK